MDRRRFSRCVAIAGATGLAGCVTSRDRRPVGEAGSPGHDHGKAGAMKQTDWDISVCGLNCAKCKLLAQGDCAGCSGPIERNWSGDCVFRPCARDKGLTHCFECAEFPCERIQAFAADGHDHHRIAVENMRRMKGIGLEAWIAEQPKVMFCPGWVF